MKTKIKKNKNLKRLFLEIQKKYIQDCHFIYTDKFIYQLPYIKLQFNIKSNGNIILKNIYGFGREK